MTRPIIPSGTFYCLGNASALWRRCTAEQIQAAVEALPDTCAEPSACTHGSCRRVAREYLEGMSQRARVLADIAKAKEPRAA